MASPSPLPDYRSVGGSPAVNHSAGRSGALMPDWQHQNLSHSSRTHLEPQYLYYNALVVPNPRAPSLPHGVLKVEGYNPSKDAAAIYIALDRFNVDEKALIKTLPKIGILRMDALADFYADHYKKELVEHIEKKKGNNVFGMTLHALVVGPLAYDVELLHLDYRDEIISSTKETILTELILDRSGEDLYRLSVEYKYKYGLDLAVKIRGDLKDELTWQLFRLALNTRRPPDSAPVDLAAVEKDIHDLHDAGESREGTDKMVFFTVILVRSRPHLAAVIHGYGQRYRSLTKVIKKEFKMHLNVRDSLKYVIEGVKPKRDGQGIWRDAKRLHESMRGMGYDALAMRYRIIRAHWHPERTAAIARAYEQRYGESLKSRVKKEIKWNSDYEDLLVAILKAEQH